MKNVLSLFCKISLVLFFIQIVSAQSGGTYQLTQTVSSTGGTSSGGTYSIENTDGQPVAGSVPQSGNYSLYIGFWTPELVPTAAGVTIGGRILTANKQGIRNVVITLTTSTGATRTAVSSSFGYFSFQNVAVGETCVLRVNSKKFIFSNPTRILTVVDEIGDLDFTAEN